MSPKSRGRKTSKSAKPARRSPGSQMREPGLREVRDLLVGMLTPLANPAETSSAYQAEVLVSVLFGQTAKAGVPAGAVTGVMLDVIDELARRDEDHCYPALRTLAVIGPDEVREYAASVAERVVKGAGADGVFRPPWVDDLGQVSVGTCRVAEDPFGEMILISCEFTYREGTRPHLIWASADATWHGAATGLTVTDEGPDASRKRTAREAKKIGAVVREATPAEAAALLLPALDALERHHGPRDDEEYSIAISMVAMARQRAEILLGPDGKAPVTDDIEERWTPEKRQALVDEFLSSPYAQKLPDTQAGRTMPLLFIGLCLQCGRDPRLIGPRMLRVLTREAIPVLLIAPDRFGELVPDGIRAWASWLAERRGLDKRQQKELTRGLSRNLLTFRALWRDPKVQPLRSYVQDLPDEVVCDGTRQHAVVERRTFAVARPDQRPTGAVETPKGKRLPISEMDAAEPGQRAMIAMNQANAYGAPARLLDAYAAVAEQIWADEPAEAWEAAQRMRDSGKSRDAVLDRLARTLDQAGGSATEGYVTALGKLR